MPFPARVFQVLIASPSDVTEEREIAVKAIHEWNALNSADRELVLLPLRWETHSSPEYGSAPQEILNRQIVDRSDLVVGIFWTRIGTPTNAADSGTLEEIERMASQSKPVMLYFSQAKQEPDRIDLDQLAKLRSFKAKTYSKALIENFTSHTEFKEKLAKQLEMQVRSLAQKRAKTLRRSQARP
jgi:nucleoside 2-deoxyribosyltransferase